MMVRITLAALLALGLAACAARYDGQDGMDGYGVAVGLRHQLDRDRR